MNFKQASKLYGLNSTKEGAAVSAVSSSASSWTGIYSEKMNKFRSMRAGELKYKLGEWQSKYDSLAKAYNEGTRSAEEISRDLSDLKSEGEKLSTQFRNTEVFEKNSASKVADTLDEIVSSFTNAVSQTAPKYDIGYTGPLNGEAVDIEAEARKKAARALATGATGTEAEEAKAILEATSAPSFVEVGTHKIGNAGAVNDLQRKIENYTEQEYSRISKQIDSIDAQIKKLEEKRDENLFGFFGSVQSPTAKIRINEELEELKKKRQSLGMERLSLDYDVDAPTSSLALLSEEENILTQKNGEKKIYEDNLKDNISHTAQIVNNLISRSADTLDLAMDKANLDTSRAVANIQDFVKGKTEGFKNAVVSPSAPELKQYSVVSEENPGEEDTRPIEFSKNPSEYTRSMVDRFVQGENNYYRSGKTEGYKVENSILAQHTEAQRNAIERSNLENIIIDLAGTIGYQIPTMTLTAATGAAGLAANMMTVGTFGTAAYAEQKREAMKAGYTDAQAELLARSGFVIEGIGETLLGDAFGAVPMLGRKLGFSIMSHFQNPVVRTMLSFLAESGEEGLEEITQSVLSEASRSFITGEDFEIDLSEVMYGGLLGALSGGVMGSAGLGQRIKNAKKVHAQDVDYINTLSVNAEAVTSADEAREMIRALEKQRAALAHVEDSESGVGDAADRAAYMDSMIRKIEVMLSEKYSLSESITPESGFEKSKEGGILGGLKRTMSEDVRFQNTDDNAVIAIEARAEAVKDAVEAEQVINAIKDMRETNDVMRELVSSKAEKNADRTNARLLEIENGLRERFGIKSGDVRHSIGYTEENAPFVTVESDILAGVPETEWIRTVKNNLREKFTNGITVANSDITITGKTRREITGSNDTDRLSNHNPQIYADKMRSTDNTDEILRASQNYVNEAPLHPRKDDIISFGRGEVLIRVGSNDYSAEVVVGNKKDGGLVLYDIVNMSPTSINERRSSPKDNLQNAEPTANQSGRPVEEGHRRQFTASDGSISVDQYQPTDRAGSNASSDTIVSQDDPGVNSQYTQKGEYDSVAEEIEVENAARNYTMPRSERAIETYNSAIMAGATVDQRSIAIELGDVFGKRVLFFFDSDKEVNGYHDRRENAIYVNVNSGRPTYSILASEMTHALEHTPEYSEIKKVALKQLQKKTNKTLSALRAEKRRIYEAREGRPLDNKYIDQELVEEYVGKFLYTDGNEIADFIRGTPRGEGRVGQWFNWLKKALARNNRIAKFIRKKLGNIQVLWADAVKRVKAEGHTPGEGVRHSINSGDDSSDVRHSYEDTEINERMRRDLETEGEKIEKERLERHYGKDPITMEEYKRRSKNGGFVSMADQAEAGEIEPSPTPGTAEAVGEAAAKEVFGENASPEKIKAESERLTSEAEAIKASDEIRTAEDAGTRQVPKSNLLFSGSEEALRKSREKINETLSAAIDRYGMSEAEINLAEEIAEGKKDVTHIPSGMNREHVSHVADIMITRNYLAGKNPETTALEKLGLRISAPLVTDYRAAPALLGWERARREAKIAADKIEKRYQLSEEEKEIAHSIADGKTSEKSYNANEVDMKKISIAAEAYRVVKQFKENGVIEHRARTRDEFQAVLDTVVESPQMATRVQNWKLTMNTMVRNNLDVFGNEVGVQVNNLLFRPIVRNEAERMRFVNRETGEFSSTFGKVSNLERQYIQMFIEAGIGIDEVANNDVKELVDKLLAAQKASQENVDDIQKSIEELADKETEGFTQYIEKKSRNKELRKAKKSLSKATQKYNALAEALENGLDIVRLANAADWFRAKYALYYDAINDFLVVHGYEPIGFIENYAPHMQEENMEKFSNVLQRLGFEENVFELPVEIAGRTENFKPGKKYNPHFQTRHGVTTRLDALAGFDSYVQHLSEVLYHTDDIQKLRQFNQSLRTALADETIQKMIDEKRAQMQRGEIDEVEGNDAIDKILDEYVKNTNLSPYVAILDEYTNVIAGKQVIGDRGTEKEFGRLSLNISNRMKKTFVRASIVGNISSAINQTVQLPLVTMECGENNVALAFQDIMSGRLNSVMDFDKQSTFITGKQGIDLLTNPTLFNNLVEKGMVPFEYVDNLMAQVIVRAKFYQLVGTGVDYNTALVLADEYAESAVASRMKGAKPLFFHNKGIIKSLCSMFQLEIANGWAHISKDIPRELMNDAKSKGKGKGTAIWKGTVMAMHYWLLAFILNRILDELHGQTPVQFDFFGWVLNLFASGYGMTSNEFIKYVYKNGFKNLPDEFDGAEAAKSGTIEFLEDVPFVQTALAITGYGDSRLAMPKIDVDKIGHGIAGIASESEDERKKGWAQLGDGIWSSVKSFLPFGNQINKTAQGIATVVKGGSYDYSGRLQYPVGNDLSNAVYNYPSYLFGKQAFNENAEFWATGGQALSERATDAYKALLDSGMKFNEAFSLAKEMSALQADEKPEVEIDTTGMDPFEEMKALFFTDYSTEEDDDLQTKVEKQVELLNSVEGLTSDQKYIAFKYLCADDKVSQMMTRLAENGADPAEAYDVMSELAITKDTEEAPRARAEYLRESSLTGWEKSYVYYTSLANKSERETIEALRELDEGEPIIYETLDDLDIEDALGGDGTAERKRAIVMNSDLSDKGKYEMYSRLFVDDSESGVKEQTLMDELISAGVDAGEVATVFSGIKDGETDAEKAQVLLDSKLTLLEIEKVYFEKIVTPSSREKKEKALESVIDAGGNVEVYLNAYIATAGLSWENGDWRKGETLGKAKAYKKAIDGVTKDRRIRRALYDVFDVSEQVW